MRLSRLAIVYLSPPLGEFKTFALKNGDVEVSPVATFIAGEAQGIVLAGQSRLSALPEKDASGLLSVPEKERAAAEHSIKICADLLAVREGANLEIKSPVLSVAYIPDNLEDTEFLQTARGFAHSNAASIVGVKPSITLEWKDYIGALHDRMDGLALLAEALSHRHPTGQFHELNRLFERAFSLATKSLVDPLGDFLASGRGDHSRGEVKLWLIEKRHPATHADTRKEFWLAAEMRPIVWRMRQAAYDVLLNKRDWKSKSPARRATWEPPAWTNAQGTIETIEGQVFRPQTQLVDEYGVFYLDLDASVRAALPPNWFVEPKTGGRAESGDRPNERDEPEPTNDGATGNPRQ